MFGELIACDLGERVVRERCVRGRVARVRTGGAGELRVRCRRYVCRCGSRLRGCAACSQLRGFAAWSVRWIAWLCSSTRNARFGSCVFLSFVRFLRLQGDGAGSALVVLAGIGSACRYKKKGQNATLLFCYKAVKASLACNFALNLAHC